MDWSWWSASIFYFNLSQYGLVVVVCKYFLFQPFSIRIGRGGLQIFFISTFLNTDWSWWSASIFYFNLSQYGLVVVVCKYFLFQPFLIRIGRGGLQVFFISTFLNTDWSWWSTTLNSQISRPQPLRLYLFAKIKVMLRQGI